MSRNWWRLNVKRSGNASAGDRSNVNTGTQIFFIGEEGKSASSLPPLGSNTHLHAAIPTGDAGSGKNNIPGYSNVHPLKADPLFTGRRDELKALDNLLQPGADRDIPPVVLSGVSGCGKTSLALEFAARNQDAFSAYFISAESRTGLLEGLARIDLSDDKERGPRVSSAGNFQFSDVGLIGHIEIKLPQESTCLLIIDSVEDYSIIRDLIPRTSRTRIIITTTARHFDDAWKHVDIQAWPRKDSVAYVKRLLTVEDEATVERFTAELFDHPLAIAQAVNYCISEGLSPLDYLNRLRQEPIPTLELGTARGHTDSVVKAITLNLNRVKTRSPEALDLLRVLALLGAEPVPENWFTSEHTGAAVTRSHHQKNRRFWQVRSKKVDATLTPIPPLSDALALSKMFAEQQSLDRCLRQLHKHSLARREPDGIKTHPLIRLLVRDLCTEEEKEKYLQVALGLFLSDITEHSPSGHHTDTPSDFTLRLPHILAVINNAENFDETTPIIFSAHHMLSRRLLNFGEFQQATHHARKAIRGALLLKAPPHVLSALYLSLASCLVETDQKGTLEAVTTGRTLAAKVGDPLRQHAADLQYLGLLLRWGMFSDAEELCRALELTRPYLDVPPHLQVAFHYNKALLLAARGAARDALDAIERSEKYLASMPDGGLFSRSILSAERSKLYRQLGSPEESAKHQREALDFARKSVGENAGLLVITHLIGIAHAEIELNEIAEADAHIEEASSMAEGLLGPRDPLRGCLLSAHGRLLIHKRENRLAQSQLKEACQILQGSDASPRGELAIALLHLGLALSNLGDFTQGAEHVLEARNLDEETYGAQHYETIMDEILLVQIYAQTGAYREAATALRRCEVALQENVELNSLGPVINELSGLFRQEPG